MRARPRRPHRSMLAAGVLATALLTLGLPAAPAQAQGLVAHLSNLHTQTRWAYPSYEALVRASPAAHARVRSDACAS